MLFLGSIGESWSTSGQFFGMLNSFAAGISTDRFTQVLSIMRFFGATLFVALLAYYATKRMASASRGGVRGDAGNLSVVESVGVGGQAVVRLVRAGDKHFVIGVTKERVTLLGEVDSESITTIPMTAPELAMPFGKILSRYIQPKDGEQYTAEPKEEGKND